MLWVCLLIGLYGYLEARSIRVREEEIFLEGLPAGFDGLRIVQISDLHFSGFGAWEKRICRMLRQVEGDLAVFTGDYKRRRKTNEDRVEKALEEVSRCVRARIGAVGVLGNKDSEGIVGLLEKAGIEVLSGRAKRLTVGEDAMWIGGIDAARLVKTTRDLIRVTNGMPEGSFKVLVSHGPDVTPLARALGYSLIICGDTHGGQIRLPVIGAPFVKSCVSRRYCRGIIREGGCVLCVSSGIGTCAFRFRFLCLPEVLVLTLRGKGKSVRRRERTAAERKGEG